MRFDITDLRLLIAIAETGSITHGAEKTHMALASASGRVKQLEERLGIPLLDRHRHGVSPTPAGECFLENARLIVQQTEKLRLDMAPYAQGIAGSLRIVTNTAALHEHLPRRLAAFLVDTPNIDIETHEMQSVDIGTVLTSGRADIGIASEADLTHGLDRRFLGEDRLVVVVPSDSALAKAAEISFSDVVHQCSIGLSREAALQRFLASQAERLAVPMPVRMRVSGFDAMGQMVEAGAGIAFMPEVSAQRCMKSMRLAYCRLIEPWASRRLVVCISPETRMPELSARLVSYLRSSRE